MIKLLKKYQVQVTPFAATKDWNLNNTDNDNLLLFESTGSDDGLPFALEFLDYGDGSEYPIGNSLCDIALEQQTNDLATSQTGLNVKGIVNTDTEPLNDDGTYKRSIYHQVKTMFYNNYLDPSKIWGVENVDFTLSQTRRNLSDQFKLVDIPRNVYGDKIIPNTVNVYDNSLDNSYTITDDGNGNLFAGKNLFSHQQELGEHVNQFISYLSSSYCDDYWANHEHVTNETANMQIAFFAGRIESQLRIDTSSISIGFLYGGLNNYVYPEYSSVAMTFGSGELNITTFPTTSNDYPITTLGFVNGYTTDTTQTGSVSDAMPFTSIGFTSGSILLTTYVITSSVSGSFDISNTTIGFISGSNITTTTPLTMSFNQVTNSIAFYRGYIM
jgi:hypothetical protein